MGDKALYNNTTGTQGNDTLTNCTYVRNCHSFQRERQHLVSKPHNNHNMDTRTQECYKIRNQYTMEAVYCKG